MTADASFGYAPGKIILLGEHAVVYGQPAIAATLDRGIRVVVSRLPAGAPGPTLRGTGFGIDVQLARPDPEGEGPEPLRRALHKVVELYGDRVRDLGFVVEGAIPAGSGLGSSAALSVAIIRGVHRFCEEEVSDEQVIADAFELEKVFHGTPSGVDHSVIARGGVQWFRRGDEGEAPYLEPVTLKRRLRLAVGIAGAHAGTAHAVAALRDRARRHPKVYERLYASIGELAQEARSCLEEGHLGSLGELMDVNQGYLNALGVSTPAIEALCAIARDRGALGAKLTGAGGGGAMLALVDDDPEPVVRAFAAAGYGAFSAEISAGIEEAVGQQSHLRAVAAAD
jgi:hydroxymethylglutaryl-CoA reductase